MLFCFSVSLSSFIYVWLCRVKGTIWLVAAAIHNTKTSLNFYKRPPIIFTNRWLILTSFFHLFSFSSWIQIEIMRIIYRFYETDASVCFIYFDCLCYVVSVFRFQHWSTQPNFRLRVFLSLSLSLALFRQKCISIAIIHSILVHCTVSMWLDSLLLWIDAIFTIHLPRNW